MSKDLLLYKERHSAGKSRDEDSYRTLLNGVDTMPSGWKAWNYTAFILILQEEEKEERQGQDGLL
ncbi:hypothetical protein [Prevotella denticola]|uniref:hypothetical protein n=1 Tax=Prevotella denticola TaxID=28129 RepID=UPI001BAA09F2|nr:hypothetical protein [Prevotella denticola]QUB91630.1 hypothetical protein J4855_04035 [Prevotella denticola]